MDYLDRWEDLAKVLCSSALVGSKNNNTKGSMDNKEVSNESRHIPGIHSGLEQEMRGWIDRLIGWVLGCNDDNRWIDRMGTRM